MAGIRILTWLALVGWSCGSVYWHVCRIKQLCDGSPKAISVSEGGSFRIPGLDIADSPSLFLSSPNNIGFTRSGAEPDLTAVRTQVDSLAAYLRGNPKRTLTLTGYYAADEKNATTFANLGVARAAGVKAYLTSQGVPEAQLKTAGELVPTLAFSATDSTYGLNYAFTGEMAIVGTPVPVADSVAAPKAQTEAGLAAAEKYESVFRPMNLYFPSAQATYIRTDENRKFLAEAKAYLAAHPDQKLLLMGHTDNEGDVTDNLTLSKRRARSVQREFEQAGVPASQLKTDGRGEVKPVASNRTPAGRKANRRVTIVVQ